MIKLFVILFLTFGLRASAFKDFNEEVDFKLGLINKFLRYNDLTVIQIPGFKWSQGSITGGTLYDLDSLKRTGECEKTFVDEHHGKLLYVTLHLGFNNLNIELPELTLDNKTMDGTLLIKKNSFKLFLIHEVNTCNISIENIEIDYIDEVILNTLNHSEELTRLKINNILISLNPLLNELKPLLSKEISQFQKGCSRLRRHRRELPEIEDPAVAFTLYSGLM